ncbi:MAG: hypothetical protein WCL14_10915 [Bacteroidota bacterium]
MKVNSKQPAIKTSPDSSGSPLLFSEKGMQRLQRIAGRTMIRVEPIGSKINLEL